MKRAAVLLITLLAAIPAAPALADGCCDNPATLGVEGGDPIGLDVQSWQHREAVLQQAAARIREDGALVGLKHVRMNLPRESTEHGTEGPILECDGTLLDGDCGPSRR